MQLGVLVVILDLFSCQVAEEELRVGVVLCEESTQVSWLAHLCFLLGATGHLINLADEVDKLIRQKVASTLDVSYLHCANHWSEI